MKKSKSDPRIQYQNHPHGSQQCSKCTMFRGPDECTDVAGKILRHGWCKIFYTKERKAA